MDFESVLSSKKDIEQVVCVVRVKTSLYNATKPREGIIQKREVLVQKRKCQGIYHHILDDLYEGVDIVNLDDVKDGLYTLVMVNEHRDWESGYIDSWDLKLIPYMEG